MNLEFDVIKILRKSIFAAIIVCISHFYAMQGFSDTESFQYKGSSYGTYDDGCLLNGVFLDFKDYRSFKSAFDTPNRYAHKEMIQALVSIDRAYSTRFPDYSSYPVLIGEASREGGGVLIPHFSHQIGLDIDFYFFALNPLDSLWPYDYVETGKGVGAKFDLERNWWLAGYIALETDSDRIFVAPEIKAAFCQNKGKLNDWKGKEDEILRKLRPGYGHRNHFHLRLNCPKTETQCFNPNKEIAQGNGCAQALEWMKKPGHEKSRGRHDYKTRGKYNIKCWKEEPNVIAYPGSKAVFDRKNKIKK